MKARQLIAFALIAVAAALAWRSELWTVARPGDHARALILAAGSARPPVALDVTLPAVPVGTERLVAGTGVLLVHYWAPWEQHSREQAANLDSLRRSPELQALRVVVVCCDPFPSVTRFVARQRLRLSVLLDHRADLRRRLPCPSVPYTYVLDARGRIAVSQPGEVDWWAAGTRDALAALLAEPAPAPAPPPPSL